jgi:hypothetical protein
MLNSSMCCFDKCFQNLNASKGYFCNYGKIRVLLLNVFEGRVISICMRVSFLKVRIYF